MALLFRVLRRGAAVLVNGRGAGIGLQQQVCIGRFAMQRGSVQGRRIVVVHRADTCPGLQ